jgi:Photosynthesis system II assembly factor YCF48
MVIATFGPSTGWVGKTIAYEDGRFTLEGQGPISAANVLTYDRQGHLFWAYAGLREWVEQVAMSGVATVPTARPPTDAQPVRGKRGFPAWAIVLIAIAALVVLVGVAASAFVSLLLRSDSGSTSSGGAWSAQKSGSTEDLRGVAFSDAHHGWAVSADGTILATTNGGATWSKQSGGYSVYLEAVAFSDATHGWVVGSLGTILATKDGGATWNRQTWGGAHLYGVAFSDASHG